MLTNFRKGTSVLLVKGTSHTGMKEKEMKGHLKKSLKKKMMDKSTLQPFSVSKSRDVF